MARVLGSMCLALLVTACAVTSVDGDDGTGRGGTGGVAASGGDGGIGGTPGCCAVEPDRVVGPIAIGAPIDLVTAPGLTSHALALTGADVVAVASQELLRPEGPRSIVSWTLLDADGSVRPAAPLEFGYGNDDLAGLTVGSIAVNEPYALVAFSNQDSLLDLEFDLVGGSSRCAGGASSSEAPDRPFRPSAVPYAPGYFLIANGWFGITASLETEWESASYDGFYRGFDPHSVRAGGDAWLGWNDTDGARLAPLQGTEPPSPVGAVSLGAAANGPVLAAGPGTLLALTWGDSLEARLVSLDPLAVLATATVTAGPISGRPAAIPWDGGFLVLWADPAGTTIRGRLLDATGVAQGDAAGLPLVALDEAVSFEPTHAVGDASGAWLSWETSAGLRAARLAAATP